MNGYDDLSYKEAERVFDSYKEKKLQKFEKDFIGLYKEGSRVAPVYDETQKLLDEVYAGTPEDIPEVSNLEWLDELYEQYAEELNGR